MRTTNVETTNHLEKRKKCIIFLLRMGLASNVPYFLSKICVAAKPGSFNLDRSKRKQEFYLNSYNHNKAARTTDRKLFRLKSLER